MPNVQLERGAFFNPDGSLRLQTDYSRQAQAAMAAPAAGEQHDSSAGFLQALVIASSVGNGYTDPNTAGFVYSQTGVRLNVDPGLGVRLRAGLGTAASFVGESGLAATGGGALAIFGSAALLSNPVGWMALGGALLLAGGVAAFGIGTVQLGLHATGTGTPEMQRELARGASLVQSVSSPGGLLGGVGGLLVAGESGFEPGMLWGGRLEMVLSLRLQPPTMHAVESGADAAGGAGAITKGEQVTEQVIREAMRDAPLRSQQAGGVSLPTVRRYVDKLLAGEVAPAIKVDGQIIVDGNHRYIAGRILGQEPAIQPWLGGRGPVVPWSEIKISTEW